MKDRGILILYKGWLGSQKMGDGSIFLQSLASMFFI